MKPLHSLIGLLATSLVVAVPSADAGPAQEESGVEATRAEVANAASSAADDVPKTSEEAVQESGDTAAAEHREGLVQDAIDALAETRKALEALESEDVDTALESLVVATGKLDLVVARDPSLALAPIDVRLVTHDLYATAEDVEEARDRAEKFLEEGRVQDARVLLEDLRSDLVVEVYNLPLATYPAAIKNITPLIDADEIERAKVALQRALNTIVVTKHVDPLPVLRTEHLLSRAEELAENEDRTDAESDELMKLLEGARAQLELAEALGYGDESDFENFYEHLDEIDEKTADGGSGTGFFDRIRAALSSFGDDSSSAN